MNEPITEMKDPENDGRKSTHYFQVDFMKMIMMMLVIMDHSFTHDFMLEFWSPFWQRIAIPLFLVIMGFNMGNSYKNKGNMTLMQMYSKEYFRNKFKRYLIPYLILYVIQSVISSVVLIGGIPTIRNEPYDLFNQIYLGYTPFWGPGMWFVPVIFTSIMVFPLLYKCYSAFGNISRIITLIACFGIEIGMQLGMQFGIHFVPEIGFFYRSHILFMFSAVVLGLWLSDGHKILSKRNIFYWILLPISIIFIYIYATDSLGAATEAFKMEWVSGDYNFLTFPYSALIFLLGMAFLPINPKGKFSNFVRRVSKSTYHILMAQILYFSIVYHFFLQLYDWEAYPGPFVFDGAPMNYLWYFPVNLIITFAIGVLWYELEHRFIVISRENEKLKNIYNLPVQIAAAFFIIRFLTQFVFFEGLPFF